MKNNQKMFMIASVLMDAGIIVIAYFLAYYLRFVSILAKLSFFQIGGNGIYYSLSVYAKLLIFLVPLYLFVYYFLRLYEPKGEKRRRTQAVKIILANIVGIALFLVFLYFTKEINISRKFIGLFFAANTLMSITAHEIIIK